MIVRLRVAYPTQTDEIEVEPDDLPRGAVIAGHFVGVDFQGDRARLDMPGGPVVLGRGDEPIDLELFGLRISALLE